MTGTQAFLVMVGFATVFVLIIVGCLIPPKN